MEVPACHYLSVLSPNRHGRGRLRLDRGADL